MIHQIEFHGSLCRFQKDIGIYGPLRHVIRHKCLIDHIWHLRYLLCIQLEDIEAFYTFNRIIGSLGHFQMQIVMYGPLRHVIRHKGPIEMMMWTIAPVHLLCKSAPITQLRLDENIYYYHSYDFNFLLSSKFIFTIYEQLYHLAFNSSVIIQFLPKTLSFLLSN